MEVLLQINAENAFYRKVKKGTTSCFKFLVQFTVCLGKVLKLKTHACIRQLSSVVENVRSDTF
jgi:hypothetical protein